MCIFLFEKNVQKLHSINDGFFFLSVSDRKTIVLLGKTGVGKSSLANTIFGEKLFKIGNTGNSETSECQAKTKSVNGRSITLIDTPGFFDTDRPEEEMKAEIVRCITECSPGPHAFVIVLKVERFTEQEQAVITRIKEYFSEEVFKYTTVLFIQGDQLDEGQTIEQYFCNNKAVSDLVKKCGGRCHVIDNKYWKNDQQDEYRSNKFQVEKLLKTIDEITEANRGGCYTNEMLQAAEEMIQQEEERIRKSSPNMSEEEIREQAKGSIFKKILIKLAGITTGALLGALLGGAGWSVLPTVKVAVVGSAAVGAVVGGFKGYHAAEDAETVEEGAVKAAEAVWDEAISVLDKANDFMDRLSHLKKE
ncbi:GTPase IMAP family member 7-like [Centropristis striata]|uniref:GTPase IMAP family member 7-like n=1 Tax=Centropristis striata TaxID=184440 RepID=UPI0027DF697B|nr:GTPase IMAP family member 7-like [Centropristis striata]